MKQRAQSDRWTWETVAGFYGVKRRFYFETEAMGREMGEAPPWDDPVRLGDWFDSARGQGLRKNPPPASLLEKVTAARMGEKLRMPGPGAKGQRKVESVAPSRKRAAGKPVAPTSARKSGRVQPPETVSGADDVQGELPLDDGDEGEADSMGSLRFLRREAARIQEDLAKHRRLGNDAGVRLESGRLKDVLAALRQWEVSAAKIRQGDEDAQRSIMAKMAHFSGELWHLITRSFMRDCPPEEEKMRRGVLNKVAESLPGLMESHFMGAAAGDQTKEAA